MSKEFEFKRSLALVLIILLLVLVLVGLYPFSNGIFGALILFVLFRPVYRLLSTYLNKKVASMFVLFLATLIIIIPFALLVSLLVIETNSFIQSSGAAETAISIIDSYLVNIDFTSAATQVIKQSGALIQTLLSSVIGGIANVIITLILLYFFLYYLFVESDKVKKTLLSIIPFNKKNSNRLMKEFAQVTNASIISSGIIALIHGTLIGLGFGVLGIGNPLLLGFLAGLLAFIPGLGVTLIWVPAGIILGLLGDYPSAIFIIVLGVMLSTTENLLRPALNKRFGRIHPLTSIVGLFIGIPLFGLLGIIIGPLLLSYLSLTVNMFRQEYL